jgi:hypothetical protein
MVTCYYTVRRLNKVSDDGVLFKYWDFWTLSTVLTFLKHNVSESGHRQRQSPVSKMPCFKEVRTMDNVQKSHYFNSMKGLKDRKIVVK